MKRVTRDVDPEDARDLLERVPRACIAFACEDGPQAEPTAFAWRDGRYLAAIANDAVQRPSVGQEVVVLIDEGVHCFDLRGISIRGLVKETGAPADAPSDSSWFEVAPMKMVAWDYGSL